MPIILNIYFKERKEMLILPFLAITLYQQVKGLKKHEKDIQDPDSATREFLEAQEQKEKSLSSAYFTRLRQQEGAVSSWVKECELYSFHTYPKQTRADCQNSNTAEQLTHHRNTKSTLAIKFFKVSLSTCLGFASAIHTDTTLKN